MCFTLRPPDVGDDDLAASVAFDRGIRAEMTAQAAKAAAAAETSSAEPGSDVPTPEEALVHG